eukprot:1583716-Rhodomonas_salina.2
MQLDAFFFFSSLPCLAIRRGACGTIFGTGKRFGRLFRWTTRGGTRGSADALVRKVRQRKRRVLLLLRMCCEGSEPITLPRGRKREKEGEENGEEEEETTGVEELGHA